MNNIKIFLLLLLIVSTTVNAGMTVNIYQQERNTEEIKIYISGLANGFAFSNTELMSLKKKSIFCPPSDLLIKVETYLQMLDQKILTFPQDKVGQLQIEPMLLSKLIEVYPCK